MNLGQIILRLREAGVEFTDVVPLSASADGEIELRDGWSIQVGADGAASLDRWDEAEEELTHGVSRKRLEDLMADIAKAGLTAGVAGALDEIKSFADYVHEGGNEPPCDPENGPDPDDALWRPTPYRDSWKFASSTIRGRRNGTSGIELSHLSF